MLNSEKIKKFILHPDVNINNVIIEYFNDSFSEDTEILKLALERYDSLKDDDLRYRLLKNSENLKLDRLSFYKIIYYLPEASTNVKYIFEKLICNADISLLMEIDLSSLKLSPNIQISIENRLKLSAMTTKMLQKELLKWCTDAEYIRYYDRRLGNHIIRELALRDDYDVNLICQHLAKIVPEQLSKYDTYLLSLAGHKRITSVIPILINCLITDGFESNEAVSALVRIGSKAVVTAIASRYYYENEFFKIHAIEVLESIKTQDSEDILLRLLNEETHFILRIILVGALCKHGNQYAFTELFNLIGKNEELVYTYLDDYIYLPCLLNDEIVHEMELLK
jgi:hypothetical protein